MPQSSSDPVAQPEELRPVLEQVLRFVDITRDLERNQDDGSFAKDDGTIFYVFDENVFEMFVRPARWKDRTATFYSAFWHRRAHSSDRHGWGAIAAQSALIAAEYLLSGQLPGQRDGTIFLTEWHQWELRERVEALIDHHRKLLAAAPTLAKPISASIDDQPFLRSDLLILKAQQGWSQEAIDRFMVTRQAANVLAADNLLEPIEQLGRLVSREMRDRFMNIADAFPISSTEFEVIATSARIWLERLSTEQQRPRRKPFRRHPGALVNDARSLAVVQWAANRCVGTNQRVVFITGDTLVFDAYRRWHSSVAPGSNEYLLPFALRRIVQYAPIFNMNDAIGDISNARELFDLTRQAVEVTLLPFNLSQMGARSGRREVIDRGREYLALKLVDSKDLIDDKEIGFFAKRLTHKWLEESRQHLNEMRQLWQQTERTAIGSMYETILPRLSRARRIVAEELAEPGAADIGQALVQYVDLLLNQIVEDGLKLWLPLASRFIDTELRRAVAGIWPQRSRLQILIRLDVPWEVGAVDLATRLERWARGEQPLERMLSTDGDAGVIDRPELIFACAAALALILSSWSNADRFSDLAKKASQLASQFLSICIRAIDYCPPVDLRLGDSVTTDVEHFAGLAAVDEPPMLLAAMGLIRGPLFAGLRRTDWAVFDGTQSQIETLVVRTALRAAALLVGLGSGAEAEWVVRQALLVSPYDERLYRSLLVALAAQGNRVRLHAAMAQLRTLAGEAAHPGAPPAAADCLHPATTDLYRDLLLGLPATGGHPARL